MNGSKAVARWASCLLLAGMMAIVPGCGGGGSDTPPPTPVAPTITTQPAPTQTVTAGNSVSFTVVATGTPAPTYQWKKGGTAVASGGTGATYTLASPVVGDAGTYTVTITNSAGTVTSDPAVLNVLPRAAAPTIDVQPAPTTAVLEGGSVTLTVSATRPDGGTLGYQWKRGTASVGTNSATLTLNPVALTDAGIYTVVVTNTLNGTTAQTTSANAVITVNALPVIPTISLHPLTQSVAEGNNLTLSVTATASNGTLSYQWKKDGTNIGTNSNSLAFTPITLADAGSYTVVVTNSLNGQTATATSNAGVLTVLPRAAAPTISVQPAPTTTVLEGGSVTLTVSATRPDGGTLGYQWKRGTTNVGTNSDSLTLNPVVLADAGTYTVVVTNTLNGTTAQTTSDNAVITVNALPVTPTISVHPLTQSAVEGNNLTLSVSATASNGTLSYQWKKDGTNIGTNSPSLAFTPVALTDAGSYTVVVTNTLNGQTATTTSNAAVLSVYPIGAGPTITTHPAAATPMVPDTATFTVEATSSSPLSYQWKKNGTAISGANEASYTTPATTLQELSATYTVDVTAGGQTITSNNATLTVVQPDPCYAGDPVAQSSVGPLNTWEYVTTYNPRGAFRLGYSETLMNSVWTSYCTYKVASPFLAQGNRDYRPDPRSTAAVADGDFSNTGYTRGHQVLMSDMELRYGGQAGTDTCFTTNLAPQIADHNNNLWNSLEQEVSGAYNVGTLTWTKPGLIAATNRMWITTGPVFTSNPVRHTPDGSTAKHMALPDGFYKIMVKEVGGKPKALAILTPHEPTPAYSTIANYVTSVARIEALSAVNLYPGLSGTADEIATFKETVDVTGWGAPFEVTNKPNVHMVEPSWNSTATAGVNYTFQGQATSSNSTVASTGWNFGDGVTATTSTASHAFAANGTYSVTFTATDALGASNTITRVITVTGGNSAPTVTGLNAIASTAMDTALDLPFTVTDDVTPLSVTFGATSSNEAIVPNSGLTFTGTDASQILHIAPAVGATGTITITLTVTDGNSATTTKTITLAVGVAPPPAGLVERFTWAGTGTAYATGDFTLSTGSWHFVTTLSVISDTSDAKNDGQGLRMNRNVAGSSVTMNFDYGDASTPVSSVSVAYGVYLSDATNSRTATFSLYYSNDQGANWTKIGNSATASSNTLSTATFNGLSLVGPIRFKLAVDGTPTARLNLDDFVVQ